MKVNEEGRKIKVYYASGDVKTVVMDSHLSDAEIVWHFPKDKLFNIGRGGNEFISKVKKIEFLEKQLGGTKMETTPKKRTKKTVGAISEKTASFVASAMKTRQSTTGKPKSSLSGTKKKRKARKSTVKKLSLAKTAIKQTSKLIATLTKAVKNDKTPKEVTLATIAKVKTRVSSVGKSLGTIKNI
jgi:hypothetical protein